MKRVLLVFFLFFATTALAAPSPEERVGELFSRMKKEKDLTVTLDYIHWPTVYKNVPEQSLGTMGVTTPEQYKDKIKMLMTNPRAVMAEQLGANLDKMPDGQKEILEKMMADQANLAETALKKEIAEIDVTEYKVISSTLDGEAAKVVVEVTKPSGSKRDEMDLILIDNVWYLAGFEPSKSAL